MNRRQLQRSGRVTRTGGNIWCRAPLCFLLALACITPLAGQEITLRPDTLITTGNRELARGNLQRARELFELALSRDNTSIPARIGVGKVDLQEFHWSDALDMFEEVLDRDSVNIQAHYYAGISSRETGTQRASFFRRRFWNKAAEHFGWVIGRDSTYEDVIYQLAVLREYDGEFGAALDLGHRQLAIRPDQYRAALGLFRIYRHYVAERELEDLLRDLQSRQSDHDEFFRAEALRRAGKFQEAGVMLARLLERPRKIPIEAVYLGLARVWFARGDPARGDGYYWKAVDHISSLLGALLIFEDLKYIVTDEELAAFSALASDRKKSDFFHRFWDLRNPAPALAANPRLAEHYRRLFRAERDYEYYGFRSWFNDPDKLHYLEFPKSFTLNHEFNDKGVIYIRHGDPDDVYRSTHDGESWLYHGTGESPQRMFHFTLENTAAGNWRLISIPVDPDMIENLASWDVRFRALANGSALDGLGMADRLREESRVSVSSGLSTDNHTWKKETRTFAVPHTINAFRGDHGSTLLNIAYAIPTDALKEHVGDTLRTLPIEVGLSLSKSSGQTMAVKVDTLRVSLIPPPAGSLIALYRYSVPADSMRIAMHVRPLGTELIATWTSSIRTPNFSLPALPLLSDIQFLLPSTARGSVEIHGVKVLVSPFDALPREDPLYVYWELYNLTKDSEGKTRYTTQVLLTPGDAGPGDDSEVVHDGTQEGKEEAATEFVRLDVSGFKKGLYTLTVRVTDRKRVYAFEKSRPLLLVGRQGG